jgi:hypothetical protein
MESTSAVIADITLFPSEISGKTAGDASGVRPNHYFPQLQSYAIGQIRFLDGEKIELGETQRARVEFLGWPALRNLLAPEVEWEIREATNIVGRGKVVEIVSNEI